jgi:hypothetical protein
VLEFRIFPSLPVPRVCTCFQDHMTDVSSQCTTRPTQTIVKLSSPGQRFGDPSLFGADLNEGR